MASDPKGLVRAYMLKPKCKELQLFEHYQLKDRNIAYDKHQKKQLEDLLAVPRFRRVNFFEQSHKEMEEKCLLSMGPDYLEKFQTAFNSGIASFNGDDIDYQLKMLISSHNFFLTSWEPIFINHLLAVLYDPKDPLFTKFEGYFPTFYSGLVKISSHVGHFVEFTTIPNQLCKYLNRWGNRFVKSTKSVNSVLMPADKSNGFCPICLDKISMLNIGHIHDCVTDTLAKFVSGQDYLASHGDDFFSCLSWDGDSLVKSDLRDVTDVFYIPPSKFWLRFLKFNDMDGMESVRAGFKLDPNSLPHITFFKERYHTMCIYCDATFSKRQPFSFASRLFHGIEEPCIQCGVSPARAYVQPIDILDDLLGFDVQTSNCVDTVHHHRCSCNALVQCNSHGPLVECLECEKKKKLDEDIVVLETSSNHPSEELGVELLILPSSDPVREKTYKVLSDTFSRITLHTKKQDPGQRIRYERQRLVRLGRIRQSQASKWIVPRYRCAIVPGHTFVHRRRLEEYDGEDSYRRNCLRSSMHREADRPPDLVEDFQEQSG